jgi:hypothetical protein
MSSVSSVSSVSRWVASNGLFRYSINQGGYGRLWEGMGDVGGHPPNFLYTYIYIHVCVCVCVCIYIYIGLNARTAIASRGRTICTGLNAPT